MQVTPFLQARTRSIQSYARFYKTFRKWIIQISLKTREGFPYFFSLKGYVPLNNRKLVLRSHSRVSNRVN